MNKIKISTRSFNEWKLSVLCEAYTDAYMMKETEKADNLKEAIFAHLLREKEAVNA